MSLDFDWPDLQSLIEGIDLLLRRVFGEQLPSWIPSVVALLLLVLLSLLAIWAILLVISKIKGLVIEEWWHPFRYRPEERRRAEVRRRFADHIESEIRRLNNLEEWKDYRFAELEAEVEAEGQRVAFGLLPFMSRTRSGLRREKSLSRALRTSRERLILLVGEPGSGKSVALRHVAQEMARKAMRARSTGSVLPVYVNLKELQRPPAQAADSALIRSYVLKTLNRANDRDVDAFLQEEFDRGLREGTWLFLFDSFDEVPEVLSSTEADAAIRSYGEAISDFLHGMNQCRGVVASRHFRGPGQFGWPRFRILPLSEEGRAELIRRTSLDPHVEDNLVGSLAVAGEEIRSMARNPMFLGLLCEHCKLGHPFPENAHAVFESYITARLDRDQQRLSQRFGLVPMEVRRGAESVAFSMAADPGLGLSPTRRDLRNAVIRLGIMITTPFDKLLDGLEYIKLGRSDDSALADESKHFTFAHRRFQEYFSTCVVLREPQRVTPRRLLTDARWRETAVTIAQTQPARAVLPLLQEATLLLDGMASELSSPIEDPVDYVTAIEAVDKTRNEAGEGSHPSPFSWPPGSVHLLALLQEGFASRLNLVPDDLRLIAGRILISATDTGTLFDRKWALEAGGIAPEPVLLYMLRSAFGSRSQWLKEVAYRQVGRLNEVPPDVAGWIRGALVGLALDGRLQHQRRTTHAHLGRLDKSADFFFVMRLLLWAPWIDLAFGVLFTILFARGCAGQELGSPLGFGILSAVLVSHLTLGYAYIPYFDWGWHIMLRIFVWLVILPIFLLGCTASIGWKLPAIYAATWYPIALLSASRGRFTHPICWPFIHAWPLLGLMLKPQQYVRNTAAILSRNRKAVILLTTAIAALFVGMWLALRLLQYLRSSLPWFAHLLDIALTTVAVAGPIALLWSVIQASAEWVRYLEWVRSDHAPMNGQEFLQLLSAYRLRPSWQRLVRAVRHRNLLAPTQDSHDMLAALALHLEILAVSKRSDSGQKALAEQLPTEPSMPTYLATWFARYDSAARKWMKKLGPEFLDEVCLLLEQVRAKGGGPAVGTRPDSADDTGSASSA